LGLEPVSLDSLVATIVARYDARHALDSRPLADSLRARLRLRFFAPAVGRVRLGSVGTHVYDRAHVHVLIGRGCFPFARCFLDGRVAVGRYAPFAGG
jgi:hypothetical protein